jgi:tyrosyl-tRNA synthetase
MSASAHDAVTREVDRQLAILSRGADELLPLDEFRTKLERSVREGRPLRVKQGFDPTAPDIHLGHAVGLRKLRQFQDLGHTVVLIVGDYTGRVGDPSGRSKTRPQLTETEVEAYARTYLDQFFRIVERSKTEIHRNGEWFAKMSFADLLRLTSKSTVARILERDDFAKRWQAQQPISVHELLYPLMQGQDSVEIRADVELGGTEQKFNLLMGRTLQEAAGQEPQAILTLPILVGLDGVQRMSKSLGNYVGITEPPSEQFGKLMSISDEAILTFWKLAADASDAEVRQVETELAGGANPVGPKKRMAERVVALYHGGEAAAHARESFERQFSKRGRPLESEAWDVPAGDERTDDGAAFFSLASLLVAIQLAKSTSDARRKLTEGAVEIPGRDLPDAFGKVALPVGRPSPVRLGRRWVQVIPGEGVVAPVKRPEVLPLPPE